MSWCSASSRRMQSNENKRAKASLPQNRQESAFRPAARRGNDESSDQYRLPETEVADENSVRELIRTCAERVLTSEQVDFDAEIDVTVVDADAIREMNAEYRNKGRRDRRSFVPDVRVFLNGEPQEELEAEPDSGCVPLGDMILCYTRACEQADSSGTRLQRVRLPDHTFRAAPARLRPRAQ